VTINKPYQLIRTTRFRRARAGLYGAARVLMLDVLVIAMPLLVGWLGTRLLGPFDATVPVPRGCQAAQHPSCA